tara:strand:+ start:3525 stop:3896 length:372 start_codon:yes stop_codon:yes gene_type:complete
MAHFARLENNIVTEVLVVPDEEEHRGQEFLNQLLGTSDTWMQTSYNNNIRKNFAGIGHTFVEDNPLYPLGAFVPPAPFPSWTLDSNLDWHPPTPMPDVEPPNVAHWDEDSQSWIEIDPSDPPS